MKGDYFKFWTRASTFFTLRTRLLGGFIGLAALSIAAVVFFNQIYSETRSDAEQTVRLTRSVQSLDSLREALLETDIAMRAQLAEGNDRDLTQWAKKVEARNRWMRAVSDAQADFQPATQRVVGGLAANLKKLRLTEEDLLIANGLVSSDRLAANLASQRRVLIVALSGAINVEQARLVRLAGEAINKKSRAVQIGWAAVGVIGGFALLLAFLSYVSVIKPLLDLTDSVREIAAGKLDHRINIEGRDEIGLLGREFNRMALSLQKSYSEVRRRYSQLTNLYKISKAISTTQDLDNLLHLALKQSLDLMGAETGSIMLLTSEGDELKIRAAEGLDEWTIQNTSVKLGEGVSGRVAATGKPLMIQDDVRKARRPGGKDIKDALSVPLIAHERVIGVINANNKRKGRFDREDLRFFTTLAGQIAAAVANATLVDNIQEAYFNTIKVLAASIDAKDKYTHGHSARVAKYAVTIAQQLELPHGDVTRIEAAAYLHDIGKIGVPDHILNKEGALTDEEFDMIKTHPQKAAEILGHINFPWGDVVPGVRGHHERYDGRGYPDGLAGEEIARDARIIAVADSFDAMTSDRPYRKGLDRTTAITEMVKGRQKQFDAEAVDAFIPALLTEWMSSLPGAVAKHFDFLTGPDKKKKSPKEELTEAKS